MAWIALIAGLGFMALKFIIFALTNSAAVLSDAMESLINVVAATSMVYTIWLSNRPADREHPYGHGKIEFLAVGLEGWMILIAGVVVAFEAIRRLINGSELDAGRLTVGTWGLVGMSVLTGLLAAYVWTSGKKHSSPPLIADGKHLMTDCLSTIGVMGGLILVNLTGKHWLDPVVALIMASLILWTSWRLLWQSIDGLMDRTDPADETAINTILDEEVLRGTIHGYHKVRHRHSGAFHWVDMHLQVDGDLSVRKSHEVASRIEGRVEQALHQANATAHIEPYDNDEAAIAAPDDG